MFDLVTVGEPTCHLGVFEMPPTELMRHMNDTSAKLGGPKVRIVKRVDKSIDWKAREEQRFADGTYTKVPWDPSLGGWSYLGLIDGHFAHISTDNPNMIAYTPNEEYGQFDRQVRVKPGKYLRQFYPQLRNDDIQSWCSHFVSDYSLHFAETADEIEWVYVNGPNSCMAYKASEYQSPVHPVRAYAGPDLQVAYLKDGDDEDARVTARTVVWPDKMIYTRVYGDVERLEPMLQALGYSQSDEGLEGARLTIIRGSGDKVVAPYVDGCAHGYISGNYIVLGEGYLDLQFTHGYADAGITCPHCGDTYDEEDGSYVQDAGENWCSHCVENYTYYCDSCDERFSNDPTNTEDGYCLCESCAEDVHRCEECGDLYYRESKIAGENSSGEPVCRSCAQDMHYDDDTDAYLTNDEWLKKQAEEEDEEEDEDTEEPETTQSEEA